MDLQRLSNIHTPAFLYDTNFLEQKLLQFGVQKSKLNFTQFFPLKSNSTYGVLQLIAKYLEGFAVSSVFEAKLAREILGKEKRVHFTSPGLRTDEIDLLLTLCDGIAFNSLSQWENLKQKAIGKVSCGLRINPQISFVSDHRYNPSRPSSRLGIPLSDLEGVLKSNPEAFSGIEGLHFHTNCDAEDWSPLWKTVQHLDKRIPSLLKQCKWMNLGGGYLLKEDTNLLPFQNALKLLQDKYSLEVLFEPGASVVRDVGYLIAQVVDICISDGIQIAVLDTTVNHIPEVFEYQYVPDIVGDKEDGRFCYILAGSTCLAGDVFGEYGFEKPLEIGSRVVFSGVGAYAQVKSHMFNGVNLPTIYELTAEGTLKLKKEYAYEDFKNRCGAT
jgi:carboxynorspermidine decarboxylase